MKRLAMLGMILLAWGSPVGAARPQPVVIGSKKFTESYVLAEIARQALEREGLPVELRPGMGGTVILWEALREGAIAAYPEYTGTLQEVILKSQPVAGAGERAQFQA